MNHCQIEFEDLYLECTGNVELEEYWQKELDAD